MKRAGLTDAELAQKIGHKRTDSVRRWKEGAFVPNKIHMKKLREITNGEITADSFYQ